MITGRWRPAQYAASRPRLLGVACLGLAVLAGPASATGDASAPRPAPPAPWQIVGDAIPAPLSERPGDAVRGRALVVDRRAGLCLLCHSGPFPEERFQGDLAPSLAGVGRRWSAGQLRLRLVDPQHLNPQSPMPAYHSLRNLQQVASGWRGRPIFDAQQVEDVLAFLQTMHD